ncbi:MAG: right-handed parallel beta-helix repeat-containing protein [Akkermansiaceae bacterium]|nr:right-handed parallel beta-helix repeat-containing protein [Akkermansiaceae bacterium]
MRTPRLVSLSVLFGVGFALLFASHTEGAGPDAYGYLTINTTEPGGPAYQFIFLNNDPLARQVVSQPGGAEVDDRSSASPPASGGIGSAVPLGAPFPFYGHYYTQLVPAVNGYLSTDPGDLGQHYANDSPLPVPVPAGSGGGARIYPLHDDLIFYAAGDLAHPGGGNGGIWYRYFPTSPHPHNTSVGVSVFQWDNVWIRGTGTGLFDFEVLLFDNGDILFQYGLSTDDKGAGATVGIQDEAGAIGLQYSANEARSIPPLPYPLGGTWAVLIDSPDIFVDTLVDDPSPPSATSLREAISLVPENATIFFDPGTTSIQGDYAIQAASEFDLGTGRHYTINASMLLEGRVKLVAGGSHRLARVGPGSEITVESVLFFGGNAAGAPGPDQTGGGILNEGDLTLIDCEFRDCRAETDGGGILNAAGATLTTGRCRFHRCTAGTGRGGGVHNAGSAALFESSTAFCEAATEGGGIFNSGQISLTNSSSFHSHAGSGGGIHNTNIANLTNCSFGLNTASVAGGGGFSAGGALLSLSNCSVAFNTAAGGGGIRSLGSLALENSLIAENLASDGNHDVWGIISPSTGRNLIGRSTGATGIGPLDLRDVWAQIGMPSDFGGGTESIPLLTGSPAIDGGVSSFPEAFDQRGFPRIVDGNGFADTDEIDIGAYEAGPEVMVNTDNDASTPSDGVTSLREAIAMVPDGGRIRFATGMAGVELPLDDELVVLGKNLVIDASDLSSAPKLDGRGLHRILRVEDGANVAIRNLLLTNGWVNSGAGNGGGIACLGSTLTLENTTLTGNGGSGSGGGVYSNDSSRLSLFGVSITGNRAGAGLGGGVFNSVGDLFALHTTISGNSCTGGGGLYNYIWFDQEATIEQSTIGENISDGSGGGCHSSNGRLNLVRCTVSANRSTLGQGGGIWSYPDDLTTTCLRDSIVAGNHGDDLRADGTNSFLSGGSNLIGTGNAGSAFVEPGDLAGLDPKLAPLGYYGGGTWTMPPLAGSPAIDGGAVRLDEPATDQRGFPRVAGSAPDIGAAEVGPLRVVDTKADVVDAGDGVLSLREAVAASTEPASRIQFDPAVFAGPAEANTIVLNPAAGVIGFANGSLMMDATNLPAPVRVSGDDQTRLFSFASAQASLHGMELWRSHDSAVYCGYADVTVDRCLFYQNQANKVIMFPGLDHNHGGAIRGTHSRICLVASEFDSNYAEEFGGAVYTDGELVCSECDFHDNEAIKGGAVYLEEPDASGFFDASTFSGHSGDAIHNNGGQVSARNCTFTGNHTALVTLMGLNTEPNATLAHCTIVENLAFGITGDVVVLKDCIVSNNPTDLGISVSIPLPNNNLIGSDPMLAPLGDYGGPTPTMLPLPGSPVIDGATSSAEPIDQRGLARFLPRDIGATEYQGDADFGILWDRDWDGDGTGYGAELALGTDPDTPDAGDPANPRFAWSGSGGPGITFGLNEAASGYTAWVVRRSTDLVTFEEIYRLDGPSLTQSFAPDVVSELTPLFSPDRISVFDQNPPSPRAFYRFEAQRVDP